MDRALEYFLGEPRARIRSEGRLRLNMLKKSGEGSVAVRLSALECFVQAGRRRFKQYRLSRSAVIGRNPIGGSRNMRSGRSRPHDARLWIKASLADERPTVAALFGSYGNCRTARDPRDRA